MEIWKPVVGYEGLYEVSNLGNVKSLARYRIIKNRWGEKRSYLYPEKILKQTDRGNGYFFVGLCKNSETKYISTHRLMLVAFYGDEPDLFACHNNGDKTDNRLENLRWDTPKNNSLDRKNHNTEVKGVCHPLAKLNDEIIKTIRQSTESASKLAKVYNVSDTTILSVRHKKTWKHV